jgi:hypothetical protein
MGFFAGFWPNGSGSTAKIAGQKAGSLAPHVDGPLALRIDQHSGRCAMETLRDCAGGDTWTSASE